jgi:AAA domain
VSYAYRVTSDQRYTQGRACPICGGAETDKRGQGTRCIGFISDDEEWARCSREESAGSAPYEEQTRCYVHRLRGECRCGVQHGPNVVKYPSPSPPAQVRKRSKSARPSSPIVATYDYVDGVGDLIYQVVRKADKSFSQRRPDGGGGWIYDLDGVAPTLYHIDEVMASPGETIWVCEGEKDTDRLRAFGLKATCNSGGAGKWPDDKSHRLRGRKVVILPDHDEVGRKHADSVAQSLRPHVADLRILDLARLAARLGLGTLPTKGDVSDLFEMGLGIGQLVTAAATAPNPFVREYATLADAHSLIGDMKWAWERWVPAGSMSLLASIGGGGKTRTAMDLARRLWFGLPMPDDSPNPFPAGTPTLWVMYDRNWSETTNVVRNFGMPLEAVLLGSPKDDPLGLTDWDGPGATDALKQQIIDQKPGLVIVDTITYATSKNTAKAEEAKTAFDAIIQLAAETGVAVLALTHLNKEGEVLNRRIIERARSVISLTQPDSKGQPDRRRIWVSKSAVKPPDALGITFTDSSNEYDDHPPEEAETPQKRRGPAPTKSSEAAMWLADQLSRGAVAVGRLVDLARADGILVSPSAQMPKPSISGLYNARDRVPAIKPGFRVDEEIRDGRKFWILGPDAPAGDIPGGDEDLDEYGSPITP